MSAPVRLKLCYIILVILLPVVLTVTQNHAVEDKEEIRKQFQSFIVKFNKTYYSTDDYNRRYNIFVVNLKRQLKLNSYSSGLSAVYGITKFSDLTQNEFKEKYLSSSWAVQMATPYSADGKLTFKPFLSDFKKLKLPDRVDWRDKNVVTAVKNQHHCGACWAFSSVESIETMHALKTGKLEVLSVQQMIDCAGDGNMGCAGGDICLALNWALQTRSKLVKGKDYPLTGESSSCKLFPTEHAGVSIQKTTCNSFVNQEDEMLRLLAEHGPLTISVDATTWNDYLGGIIQFHCSARNNHAVQIVGYDLTGEVPYYIVRNSWGSDFGLGGYLRIKYGANVCGVAMRVATVTV